MVDVDPITVAQAVLRDIAALHRATVEKGVRYLLT